MEISGIHPPDSGLARGHTREAVTARYCPTSPGAYETDFSAERDVFKAVDDFFDMSRPARFSGVRHLGTAGREQFYRMVGTLLMHGYVGYETLVVNKKVERHDLTLQVGDRRLKGARPYRGPWDQCK